MRTLLGLILFTLMLVAPASAGGYTFGVYGGANWNSFDVDEGWVKAESDVGYVIGAEVGKSIDAIPGLAVKLDLNYRSNDIDTTICDTPLIVTDETWAIMTNVEYQFAAKLAGFRPYVMAGAGYGSRTVSVDYTDLSVNNTGLVWQVGAGARAEVADGVQLGFGYRYFDAPDFDIAPTGGFHDAGTNHSAIVEVAFALN